MFDAVSTDLAEARQAGYSTILEAFEESYANFIRVRETSRAGVCAKVTIQISQDVVLTRNGFEAKLQIDNGGDSDMTGIQVIIRFSDAGQLNNATDRFAVDSTPELVGLTGVNGEGRLAAGQKGDSTWLIIRKFCCFCDFQLFIPSCG